MKKLVIANWKMNPPSLKKAQQLFREINKGVSRSRGVEVVIAPPFIYLDALSRIKSSMVLGAQDVFWEAGGPFTGEISSTMLRGLRAKYVIIGHSERRRFLAESDAMVAQKVHAALVARLSPIVCVGEHSRENFDFYALVKEQLYAALQFVKSKIASNLVVVYEPVWAISSGVGGRADNPKSSFEMSIFIRKILHDMFGARVASQIPILYGGSVNGKTVGGFVSGAGVDGFLVGGASLRSQEFSKIINTATLL